MPGSVEPKRVFELYIELENLERSEEIEIQNNDPTNFDKIEKTFIRYFNSKSKRQDEKLAILLDEDTILTKSFPYKVERKGQNSEREDLEVNGETLLFRALSILSFKTNDSAGGQKTKTLSSIINLLINNCTDMIVHEVNTTDGKVHGMTPLHQVILLSRKDILETMLLQLKAKEKILSGVCASGKLFKKSPMIGGTLLGVATLTCDKEIFNLLLRWQSLKICINSLNSEGDNIVHSMIKFANLNPDRLSTIEEMLTYILDKWPTEEIKDGHLSQIENDQFERTSKLGEEVEMIHKRLRYVARKKLTMQLLMSVSKEGFTPLQLAAKKNLPGIFKLLMNQPVYCSMESSDCVSDLREYDVTEIDTVSLHEYNNEVSTKYIHHESVLEYIVRQNTKVAFEFADFFPVCAVIKTKWKRYRWMLRSWCLFHILFMILLTCSSVERSKMFVSPYEQGNESEPGTAKFKHLVLEDVFVTFVSGFSFPVGLFYLVVDLFSMYHSRFKAKTHPNLVLDWIFLLTLPYSSFLFRIYFRLFATLLVLDSAFAFSSATWYEHYFASFALLFGWYLVLFFIQTIKFFSFYTVLIQRVLVDLAKFSFVMGIFLVSFSAAMFIIMQGAQTDEDDFRNIGKCLMKMFSVMLGFSDISTLFKARNPALGIVVFVLFVLLTTVMLLNALIAMMSNTCSILTEGYGVGINNKMHGRLQKLSAVLFIESILPTRFLKKTGVLKRRLWYEGGAWTTPKRPMISKRSMLKYFGNKSEESIVSEEGQREEGLKSKNKIIPIKGQNPV